MSNLHYADLAIAKKVLPYWSGDAGSLRHLGNSASSVFAFVNTHGKQQILRLTDSTFRTGQQVAGALNFVRHLDEMGCLVNQPVPTSDGSFTTSFKGEVVDFVAAAFTYVEGETVDEHSPHWNEAFFRVWGATLGQLHVASRGYTAIQNYPLWHWDEEVILAQKHALIPQEDVHSGSIIDATLYTCNQLTKDTHRYGVVHGDFGPQNFFFHPQEATITAIDFGNSCHHYFVSDLANIQLWLGRRATPAGYWSALLEGYAEHHSLPADLDDQLALFRRLRIQYIYLDRLYTSGAARAVEMLREKVLKEATWL